MRKLITSAMLASLLLSACVPVVVGGAAVGGYFVGKDDRPVGIMASDTGITASIKGDYVKEDSIKSRNISVDTYYGVVTLDGTVPSRHIRDKAIAIAYRQKGVTSVISNLRIE